MSYINYSIAAALVIGTMAAHTAWGQPAKSLPFPALNNSDAWRLLPRERPPLPAWARILVESLPKTTAAMLHLDYVHRERNPLGPIFYGKIRWVAADANRCTYSKRYAEADLRRAGLSEAEIKQLAGSWREMAESDRKVLEFARKLTLAGYTVTDDEVAYLLKHFGPEKLVALVHTLAHANFQDRIILALGIEVEADGPFAPIDLRLDSDQKSKLPVPSRSLPTVSEKATTPMLKERPKWVGEDPAVLEKSLDRQKVRNTRIAIPPMERLASFPPETQKRMSRIIWSRVSLGYSPLLTQAWFDCMNTFNKEAELDEVFANTYFWVITRSNECFY